MVQGKRFRRLLPIAQTVLAAMFGGLGLWQRSEILSHSLFGWNFTARYHVWPWPYKLAVVSNTPAFLAALLLSWPIGRLWPELPEWVQIAPSLLFVPMLWYWIGSRLDRRWGVLDGGGGSRRSKSPWILLLAFALVCVAGAFLPLGYVGYLPYGTAVWIVTGLVIRHVSRVRSEGSPAN
jgi:hypothetical protein